jgi:exodeoxyribonuclease VII small subunit
MRVDGVVESTDDGAASGGSAPEDATEAQTYEQARDELARVVTALESGGLTLEESLALWERGERLARISARFLDGARARVEAALERSRADENRGPADRS